MDDPAGLEVVLYIPADAERGGTTYRPTVRAAANTEPSRTSAPALR
jgi:hypothetical protein